MTSTTSGTPSVPYRRGGGVVNGEGRGEGWLMGRGGVVNGEGRGGEGI